MVMWKTKSCPKCGGDLFIDSEDHIMFDHCLQCSYMKTHTEAKCPNCGSGMMLDSAGDGKELHCDTCGHTIELHLAAQTN